MKATVIKRLERRRLGLTQQAIASGAPLTRVPSRAASIHESLYSNRTSFIQRAARKVGFGSAVHIRPDELQRFGTLQAQRAGVTLEINPSLTPVAGPSTA
jgi:H+-transporting ATPase